MGQSTTDEIDHGDEVACAAVAAGAGLGGLDQAVGGLDAGVVEPRVEGIEDAVPVGLDGQRQALEGLEPAAPCPAVPALEFGGGDLARRGLGVELAQGVLESPRACGLQPGARERVEALQLPLRPAPAVLEPHPAGVLEHGLVAHLRAAHFVDGLIGQLDDMEAIEGDCRRRQVLAYPGDIGLGHVDARRRHRGGGPPPAPASGRTA